MRNPYAFVSELPSFKKIFSQFVCISLWTACSFTLKMFTSFAEKQQTLGNRKRWFPFQMSRIIKVDEIWSMDGVFFYRSKQKRNKSISIFFSSRFGNRRCNCCDKQLISYHIKTNRHDSAHLTLAHSFASHVPVEEFVVFHTSAIHRQLNLQIVICIICNGSEWMWCGCFWCMNLTLLYSIISTQSTKAQT